ncbi:hypothetical protein SDC9_111404 [bioreactor metagenome]|uniref:Uncharacterized protein n=1 Tax=bioreactor metagenome TaxID=1076179 RepID=A0A645BGN1_9ZZZZ
MVRVFAVELFDMQCNPRRTAQRGEELLHQLGVKRTDLLRGDARRVTQAAPAGEIDRAEHERFIHRQQFTAIAHDTAFFA